MEVSATILYERPHIETVDHTLTDRRPQGGLAVLEVIMRGDPGLIASFDIQPGVIDHQPMKERSDGEYTGSYGFPAEAAGGPYTIIARLKHEKAGEVTFRVPDLVTIPLSDYPSGP